MHTLIPLLIITAALAAHGGEVHSALPSGLHKLHPPFTHFAVALPLALFVTASFQVWRFKTLRPSEGLLFCLAVLGVVAAAATGMIAHNAVELFPISDEAKTWLHRHEDLGTGLAFFYLLLSAYRFRLHVRPPSKTGGYRPYLLLLLLGSSALLVQGAIGGMLVYDFGVGTPGKM